MLSPSAHTGHKPVFYSPLCPYIACCLSCDLTSVSFSSSFFIVPVYLSSSVFTDFSLDISLCCLVVSSLFDLTRLCLHWFFFFFFFLFIFCDILFLSVGHCSITLSPNLLLSHLLSFFFSSSCTSPSSSSSLYFHPVLPFLCLYACRCRMCAATFFSKSDMQIHSKSHTEAKPHKCPHCAKSFANSSYLAQHIRIHSGAKPYTCSYCQKSFRQLSHLQQHSRYYRPPQPHYPPIPYTLFS